MAESIEKRLELIDTEFNQVRMAAYQTSVNILSLRIALVDKGICTEEEILKYDETAKETMSALLQEERKKMLDSIRENLGDEAAKEIEESVSHLFKID